MMVFITREETDSGEDLGTFMRLMKALEHPPRIFLMGRESKDWVVVNKYDMEGLAMPPENLKIPKR